MDDFGFVGIFVPVPRNSRQKENLSFAILGPAEGNEPNKSIEKRIKSKLAKYKWEGPIFVAICMSADLELIGTM